MAVMVVCGKQTQALGSGVLSNRNSARAGALGDV